MHHVKFSIYCLFKTSALTLLILLATQQVEAQQSTDSTQVDLIDVIVETFHIKQKDKDESDKRVSFSFVPVAIGASPSGKVAVSSINAAFYLGDPVNTNLSNIFLIPYTNLSNQRGLIIRPTIWLSDNKWNFVGEIRRAANELNTYGLSGDAPNTVQSVLEEDHFRFYGTAHHLITHFFYGGVGYNLDYFYNVNEIDKQVEITDASTYALGTSGNTTSSGFTFNLLRDSRKNSINPTGGFYTAFIYKFNAKKLGSTYEWQSFYADARKYLALSDTRHRILGFWIFYWGTFGDVPYLNLPGTAQDFYGRAGRGYKFGRFRGKQMLYAETEYRFNLSQNGFWGGVVFANAQSFTEPGTTDFKYVKPATGFGLRVKFNKRSNANVTLDFAFGKDSFNWYLNLGEFF